MCIRCAVEKHPRQRTRGGESNTRWMRERAWSTRRFSASNAITKWPHRTTTHDPAMPKKATSISLSSVLYCVYSVLWCTVHSDSCAMWCDAIAAARHHRTHGIMAYSHEQSLSFVLHPHSFTNLLSSCKVREPYAPSLGIESQYFPPKHTMPSHPTVLWAHNQFVTNASPI